MNYEKECLRLLINTKDLEAEIKHLVRRGKILEEALDIREELLMTLRRDNEELRKAVKFLGGIYT